MTTSLHDYIQGVALAHASMQGHQETPIKFMTILYPIESLDQGVLVLFSSHDTEEEVKGVLGKALEVVNDGYLEDLLSGNDR